MATKGEQDGFFQQLGQSLRKAGSKTKQYGRLGMAKIELEQEKSALRKAYAELGETVMGLWEQDAQRCLGPEDPDLLARRQAVLDARARIGQIEERMETIRREEP